MTSKLYLAGSPEQVPLIDSACSPYSTDLLTDMEQKIEQNTTVNFVLFFLNKETYPIDIQESDLFFDTFVYSNIKPISFIGLCDK